MRLQYLKIFGLSGILAIITGACSCGNNEGVCPGTGPDDPQPRDGICPSGSASGSGGASGTSTSHGGSAGSNSGGAGTNSSGTSGTHSGGAGGNGGTGTSTGGASNSSGTNSGGASGTTTSTGGNNTGGAGGNGGGTCNNTNCPPPDSVCIDSTHCGPSGQGGASSGSGGNTTSTGGGSGMCDNSNCPPPDSQCIDSTHCGPAPHNCGGITCVGGLVCINNQCVPPSGSGGAGGSTSTSTGGTTSSSTGGTTSSTGGNPTGGGTNNDCNGAVCTGGLECNPIAHQCQLPCGHGGVFDATATLGNEAPNQHPSGAKLGDLCWVGNLPPAMANPCASSTAADNTPSKVICFGNFGVTCNAYYLGPQPEYCNDNIDSNCDGTDNGPGQCISPPPTTELCDLLDNDQDGLFDEGDLCPFGYHCTNGLCVVGAYGGGGSSGSAGSSSSSAGGTSSSSGGGGNNCTQTGCPAGQSCDLGTGMCH